jgi:hypothetical protein
LLKDLTFISIQHLPLLTYAISTYKTKPILGEKKISERPLFLNTILFDAF